MSRASSWAAVRAWPARRWIAAALAALGFALVVAVPTDLVDTPLFGREVPPTWWAWPSLVVSSVLAGLLVATYVAAPDQPSPDQQGPDPAGRGGWVGGTLTFFAVGCPVCNKLVLLALGSAGAMTWFEPVQPVLQLLAVALLAWALRRRLLGESSCAAPTPTPTPVWSDPS
ncbi:hypothetical protein NOK12_23230 [Nocardioides sp. OK12]|uniref:hypothetical protein n=1 Tax=Nocardioides TaxID=1839 RepID=UPI0021C32392|nr:hypothetical protein [Nocardioides sp. OK12]GHJ59805.1 hypothetical protein NOK12_23230 [Nocardioides sp. OK12]